MADFHPEVFVWARERAGLTVPDAASSLHIKTESLEAVEAGVSEPSRALLMRMTKTYRRSLLTFYLPAPPTAGDRGHDFRTVVSDRVIAAEAAIDALARDLRSRQAVVRSTLEDEEDAREVPFIGSVSMRDGVQSVARAIEEGISFDRDEFRRQGNAEQAFALLRGKVERTGIFVLLVGNLGSHHSTIPIEAFRGMAIADPIAPFVVINDQDAKVAWSFTLLHELTHLWLGASGVSAGHSEQNIEVFCNEVAAELLAPGAELGSVEVAALTQDQQIDLISRLANVWNVSRPMIAYRLMRAGRLQQATWRKLDATLNTMWAAERQHERAAARSTAGGPSYYVVRRHKLGKAMLDFASRSMSAGTLSPVKAAQVLGVSPRSVSTLLGAGRSQPSCSTFLTPAS